MTYVEKSVKRIGNALIFLTTSLEFDKNNRLLYKPNLKRTDIGMSKFETKDVIDVTIDVFLQKVNIHLKKNDELLDSATLQKIAKDFKSVAYSELTDRLFERRSEERSTENAFDRVLMSKIEHLFQTSDNPINEVFLIRHIEHAFFVALDRMLGTDVLENRRKEMMKVVKKYHLPDEENFNIDWQSVYNDKEAQSITENTLMDILHHFEIFEHRKKWMLGVFDINVGAVHLKKEPNWQFGDAEFFLMMSHLYSSLKKKLIGDEKEMIELYGGIKITQLARFLSHIAKGVKLYKLK